MKMTAMKRKDTKSQVFVHFRTLVERAIHLTLLLLQNAPVPAMAGLKLNKNSWILLIIKQTLVI